MSRRFVRVGYDRIVQPYYDHNAIKLFVSRAIEAGERGTQAQLARALKVPPPTITKWSQRQTCPSPEYWPVIEEFFGWEPDTIAGVGGLAPSTISAVETAILGAAELDDDEQDALLRMYHVIVARRSL